jgi:hypothetical protein
MLYETLTNVLPVRSSESRQDWKLHFCYDSNISVEYQMQGNIIQLFHNKQFVLKSCVKMS